MRKDIAVAVFVMLAVVSLVLPGPGGAAGNKVVKRGDTGLLEHSFSAKVMNPDGVGAGPRRYLFGEHCAATRNDYVVAVGVYGERVLARLSPGPNRIRKDSVWEERYLLQCPVETLLFMTRSEFLEARDYGERRTALLEKIRTEEKRDRAIVRELLNKETNARWEAYYIGNHDPERP